MNPHNENWKETRKMGMLPYLLFYGVILWGIPMFFIETFFIVDAPDKLSWFYSETSKYSISWLTFMFILACLSGLLYGIITWHYNERKKMGSGLVFCMGMFRLQTNFAKFKT